MHARNAIEEPSPSTPSSTTGKGVRNTSIAPALTQCFQLRTSRRFHLNVTTGLRVLTDRAIASISMDTQLREHCGYDHTNDGDLGKPLSQGVGACSVCRAPGPGSQCGPIPSPPGVPLPLRAQWPGQASGISGVKNQPHGRGHGEPLGLSLKTGFHRLHRHEVDAMQPAHGPARLRPEWFVCWPGCCAKTP